MLNAILGGTLPVGTPAPTFSLPDQDGNLVSLAQLRGQNVVLIFYPRDETTVCRKQLCEFRDASAVWSRQNTVVFGINPQDAASHRDFRHRHKFPFPLLVDTGGRVAAAYQAGWRVLVRRTVYLIDPAGNIAYAARGKPDPSAVLAAAS